MPATPALPADATPMYVVASNPPSQGSLLIQDVFIEFSSRAKLSDCKATRSMGCQVGYLVSASSAFTSISETTEIPSLMSSLVTLLPMILIPSSAGVKPIALMLTE